MPPGARWMLEVFSWNEQQKAPEKEGWLEDKMTIPFGIVYFQVRTAVGFREGSWARRSESETKVLFGYNTTSKDYYYANDQIFAQDLCRFAGQTTFF